MIVSELWCMELSYVGLKPKIPTCWQVRRGNNEHHRRIIYANDDYIKKLFPKQSVFLLLKRVKFI